MRTRSEPAPSLPCTNSSIATWMRFVNKDQIFASNKLDLAENAVKLLNQGGLGRQSVLLFLSVLDNLTLLAPGVAVTKPVRIEVGRLTSS